MTERAGRMQAATMAPAGMAEFITAHTRLLTAGLVPEIRLHLAEEPLRLWEMTEHALGRPGFRRRSGRSPGQAGRPSRVTYSIIPMSSAGAA